MERGAVKSCDLASDERGGYLKELAEQFALRIKIRFCIEVPYCTFQVDRLVDRQLAALCMAMIRSQQAHYLPPS